MKIKISIVFFLITISMSAQKNETEKLPYYEIPDYPSDFNAATVAARLIDGLGFRYYWATEGLRETDLKYRPSAEARSTEETIEHIYSLSKVIVNTSLHTANRIAEEENLSFDEKRRRTLQNFKTASDIYRYNTDVSEFKIVFERENGSSEFPFWNQINGPISDAIWHCGQIVLLRRSSGNPFNSKASVFTGKVRD
jgi:hypothetical protein